MRSYLSLAVGVLLLGISAPLVRAAQAPGPVSMFYRMLIGGLVLTPWGWSAARRVGKGRAWRWSLLGGVLFGINLALWATGIMLSGATMPTLMGNTNPIWVGLGAYLLFHERQGPAFWSGLMLALLGAAVVLNADFQRTALIGLGTALGLVGAIFYGAYHLITQRGRQELEAIAYLWLSTWASVLVLGGLVAGMGYPLAPYPLRTWGAFLAMGVVIQAGAWWLINEAQGQLPASLVAPTLLLQPVLTAVISGALLGEQFTARHLLGGAMVLGGVYLIHRARFLCRGEPASARVPVG